MALFSKEYENEWIVRGNTLCPKSKLFRIPFVPPFPDNNVQFDFQALYRISDSTPSISLFQLKLAKKLMSASISPTLKVSVSVKVNYSDGSLFVDYPNLLPQNVKEMSDVAYNDVFRSLTDRKGHHSEHARKMTSNAVIIKCKMIFSDQHQVLHTTSANAVKSCGCVDAMGNLKSVYEPSVLSDFTFNVGDRSFPAHKVILSAHSPVFTKMMTQEFLESKTSTVTITDATPEIFDTFLRSLYTCEIGDKSLDSLKGVYCLADKYDVGFLKKLSTLWIVKLLSIDLACEILVWAYSYPDSDLKTAAVNFAFNHVKEIALRDDWKELVKTQPMIAYEVVANLIPK